MVPIVEHFFAGGPKFRTGMEQLLFHETTSGWMKEQQPLPEIITKEFLEDTEASPAVLAIIRRVARRSLLRDLSFESTDELKTALRGLTEAQPIGLGQSYAEPTDNDRTTNRVIPLKTSQGIIEIVINPAWGVGWRLDGEHQLVTRFPQLGVVQHSDETMAPAEIPRASCYISPETLASVTHPAIVDVSEIEERARNLIERFFESGAQFDFSALSLGGYEDRWRSALSFMGLYFTVGEKLGVKEVIHWPAIGNPSLHEAGFAWEEQVDLFYRVKES